MADLIVFVAIVGVVAVAGVRIGMLVAPRIGRLAEAGDAEATATDPEPAIDAPPDADASPSPKERDRAT